MKKIISIVALSLAALSFAVSGRAQVTTSSIGGKITDEQGPLAGVAVIATYIPSGSQFYTVSDAGGHYRILNVRAGGPYEIKAQILGCKDVIVKDVATSLGETTIIDIRMEPEALSLTEAVVTVEAKNSNMRTDRAGSITTVDSKAIAALPTVSRSMNDVMSLTPTAAVTTNGLAVGGGNYRQSYVTVDGAAFNNAFGIGSNLPAGGTPISLDALEQMSVSVTPFDVRNSGFTGGAIQTVTKSGTNDLHVNVYDYFKNNALIGTNVAGNNLKVSETLNNTTGVSVGGPIIKDKLFFFVNFEYDVDNNPGQSRLATAKGAEWNIDNAGQYNRPTEDQLDAISQFLQTKFNYNPGEYQGYSFNTPDWKMMARIDWNINKNNHFSFRFSKTQTKAMNSPSSSVSPFGSTALYDRNSYGRTSKYALYFSNACYYQEQNFTSFAGELNSRLFDGKGANILRVAYSHQYEPRSYNGQLFPTVDILENTGGTKAVYTTFGIDPFTYGNLRDVSTWTATDELSYTAGKHNLLAGLQFEHNNAKNGYMQMGAGYYLYASWQDFVDACNTDGEGAAPLAFAITHGNNNELKQEFPYLNNMKLSAYLQDEIDFSDNFKLTAGIRFELPAYPSMEFNENKEFTALYADKGWKTSDVPAAYLAISPRVGFNWDVLGNRKVVVRGGTGVYTGSLPMVWLVSAVGNSNVMQNQILLSGTDPDLAGKMNYFRTDIQDMLKDYYGGTFTQKDLPAPTSTTILDKNLKLPTTWKSSLAVDFKLPGGIDASVEGIFNKDIHSVMVLKEGLTKSTVQLPGEPQARSYYTQDSTSVNSSKKNVNPYYVTNSEENGYYYSVTAKLEKHFKNLSLMAAYTRANSVGINDGLGDQVTSVFSTNTYSINGSNESSLGYSSYVSPNRVVASASYKIDESRFTSTTIGAFYEGCNMGYVGNQYSYTRWNYTFGAMTDPNTKKEICHGCVTGDGGAFNLIYIPTDADLANMDFDDQANKTAFAERLASDKYLSAHRGEYAERGGIVMPWHNALNLKVAQDFRFGGKHSQNIQVGLDIKNVLNLINPNWGLYKTVSSQDILRYNDSTGKYSYNPKAGVLTPLATTASTWQMLLSVRYSF